MGPAGVTAVIVRDDLLDGPLLPGTPDLLSYKLQAENGSMINTPATYACICSDWFWTG
jgi:phosphoserine aminotransferase